MKNHKIVKLPDSSKNAKIGSIWWEIKDSQRYPWMITDLCFGYSYGGPQICQKIKPFVCQEISVVLESAVGPYVEYASGASVEAVEASFPEGWTSDFSSQIKLREGVYRSPLVREDFVDFENYEKKFDPQSLNERISK